jgi:two-component system, sensor histidine kinase RegB
MSSNGIQSSARILRQLYLLRNVTIVFISLMVTLAFYGLNINLPVTPLSIILLIMAATNLLTRLMIDQNKAISQRMIFIQLMIEIISFSLILYFSGGATNPLTFFYLIPLAIAATVIPGRYTWMLTMITIVLYSLLLEFYIPLSYQVHDHQHMQPGNSQFNQHVLGMWFGFLVSSLLVTWFITYLAQELKSRDIAISEARQRELRDQQMVTLGTLAAGTAHELSTPLATLAIVTGELTDGFDAQKHEELFENQQILRDQIARCKDILSVLSESAGEARADEGYLIPAEDFIDQTIHHWQSLRDGMLFELNKAAMPHHARLLFDKTISQSVINLLNNAAEVSTDSIQINTQIQQDMLEIEIIDSGPGMSDEQIQMAGETSFSDKPHGMGIGLFLAISTLRRSGGSVQFERLTHRGTSTLITMPLILSESK